MTLKQELQKTYHVAPATIDKSKIFTLVEEILAKKDFSTEATSIEVLTKKLDDAEEKIEKLGEVAALSEKVYTKLADTVEKMNIAESNLEQETTKNQSVVDALVLYKKMLKITKEIIGDDKMTEAVIVKLLETASYGIWKTTGEDDYNENEWKSARRR